VCWRRSTDYGASYVSVIPASNAIKRRWLPPGLYLRMHVNGHTERSSLWVRSSSILMLHQVRYSNRQIANLLGIHRETVADHIAAVEVPAKPDPRVHPGPLSACEPLPENG